MRTTGSTSLYRVDSVATSVGVVAVASAASRLIGFARGVALAWLIPQAQFGLFGVALLVVNVLLPLCSAGLYEGVARYTPLYESAGTLRRFVVRASAAGMATALAATAILWVSAGPVGSALFSAAGMASGAAAGVGVVASGTALMQACAACVLALAAYHALLGFFRGLRMFRAMAAAELLSAAAFTGLALAGAIGGLTSARALVVAYAVACAAVVVIFAPGLVRRATATQPPDLPQPPASSEPRRPPSSLWTYSAWAAAAAMLWHALSYYPMWHLLKVSDERTVAMFHAVRLVAQFVQIGAAMLTAVVAAHVNRLWEHEGREVAIPYLDLLTRVCLILLIAGATIMSLARPLVMRLFPASFAAGEVAYDPLVLFFYLVGAVGWLAVRLNVLERPSWVCAAWLIGAIVNVAVCTMLLAPADDAGDTAARSLAAAAWAGVIGMSGALAACVWFVRREGLGVGGTTFALLLAGFSTGGGWAAAVPVLGFVLLIALGTQAVFSRQERVSLYISFFAAHDR